MLLIRTATEIGLANTAWRYKWQCWYCFAESDYRQIQLLYRKCRPLWAYEDITSKVHRIKSAESIEHLLKYVLRIFRDSLPSAHIEQRWAQESIHMALSCSSRHCAGRSFQVYWLVVNWFTSILMTAPSMNVLRLFLMKHINHDLHR